MPIRITCSNCQTPYALPETMSGKKVRCAKCKQVVVVPVVDEVDEDLQLEIVEPEVATRAKQATASAVVDAQEPDSDDEEEVEEVVAVARKRRQSADDDVEEDEEEERPRRKRKRKRRSKVDTGGADLFRVALYQKIVLICVLVNITLVGLFLSQPDGAMAVVVVYLSIPVSILSSILIFLLTKELFGIGIAVLLGVLSLVRLAVPSLALLGVVQLVVLLVINAAATRLLKRNGLSVGLLGASISEARRISDDENSGLSASTIGGIVAILVLGALACWYGLAAGRPDGVGSTSWPELQNPIPIENAVTLQIAGVRDKATFDALTAKVKSMVDPDDGRMAGWNAVRNSDRMVIQVGPVADPKAFAARIDFGTVRSVTNRLIRVDVP